MYCVKCGKPYDRSYTFCNNCGIRLPRDSAQTASPNAAATTVSLPLPMKMEEAERMIILATLRLTDNNKTRAAELLDVSLKTLHNKLHAYGLAGAKDRV